MRGPDHPDPERDKERTMDIERWEKQMEWEYGWIKHAMCFLVMALFFAMIVTFDAIVNIHV